MLDGRTGSTTRSRPGRLRRQADEKCMGPGKRRLMRRGGRLGPFRAGRSRNDQIATLIRRPQGALRALG